MFFFCLFNGYKQENMISLGESYGSFKLPGGDSHMEGTGMLVGNFDFTPKRDQSRRGRSLCRPLKETRLKYRQIKSTMDLRY